MEATERGRGGVKAHRRERKMGLGRKVVVNDGVRWWGTRKADMFSRPGD